MTKVAFGGGCHWCTEAVFQSLKGVKAVEQGFIASTGEQNSFSEAVVVHFNSEIISLKTLIEIHLLTHRSTSNHSMRDKYRSAVYTYSATQTREAQEIINSLQSEAENLIITKVYPFSKFKPSRSELLNYYYSNPKKPFCERFIVPKIKLLQDNFNEYIKSESLN